MRDAVHRQQELRRRLLAAAYEALISDADGFLDACSLTLADDDGHPDGVGGFTTFREVPPTQLEWRAAAFYLLQHGFLLAMNLEGLARRGLKGNDLYVHITAPGVDEFEGSVLDSESRGVVRPIGFRVSPPLPDEEQAGGNPSVTAGGGR
jgi:hypothetical protein